uniref:Uncharacterized protein n=1 Tax=Hordeum vulgare subsp. vulgare TaxID=112509 RepID=A0A8I6X1L1_HORVV
MPGRIPCNETPVSEPGDFVVILADLSRQVFGIEEPPVYVVHEEPTSEAIRYFWASVHTYGGNPSLECPHHFTGRAATNEAQARQLAAREAIVQMRHPSPCMNSRLFFYYPSREDYGSLTRVANGDLEGDPTLVQVVRYLRAQEALVDLITSNLIMSRMPTARRTPTSYEATAASNNQHVFFGRHVGPLRFAPPAMTPAELHHSLDAFYSEAMPRARRPRRHRHRNPAAPLHGLVDSGA